MMDLKAIDEMYKELTQDKESCSNLKNHDLKIEKIRDDFRQYCMKKKSNKSDAIMMDQELISNLKDIQEKSIGVLVKYMKLNTSEGKSDKISYSDISELVHDFNLHKENLNFNAWQYETIANSFFEK